MNDSDARHECFLRLFAEHEPAVRSFVRTLLPSREEAREVLQEVAVVLWKKFDSFDLEGDFRKWAFGIARFEVLAFLRDRARDRHVFSGETLELIQEDAVTEAPLMEAQREALDECVSKLPAAQRLLLSAAYAPMARIDQIARERGQTAMSLYKTLHRIRMALVECTRRFLAKQELA